jgi:hypothetical protein
VAMVAMTGSQMDGSHPHVAADGIRARLHHDRQGNRLRDLVVVGIFLDATTVFWPGRHGGGWSREAIKLGAVDEGSGGDTDATAITEGSPM